MADDSETNDDTSDVPAAAPTAAPAPLMSAPQATGPAPMSSPYPSWIKNVYVAPQPAAKPAMWNTVVQQAASAGVDPDVMWRMFGSERSYQDKPNPFQIMPNTAAGLRRIYPSQNFGDPNDPVEGARMAPWALASSNHGMAAALGHAPNGVEQYMGWVFGPKAVNVLTADPNTPISKLLPQDWVDRNPNKSKGPDGMPLTPVTTAGDLRWWVARRMGYDNPYGTKGVGDGSDMPAAPVAPAPQPQQQPPVDYSDPKGAWSQGITPLRDSSGPVTFDGVQPQVRQGMHALQQQFGDFSVSSSTAGGHNDGSYHYRGLAFDVPTAGWSQDKVADFITKARQSGFTGIGIDGVHVHLDMRPGNLLVFKDDHYTGPVGGLDPAGWQAKLAGVTPGKNLADQPSSVGLATSSPLMPPTDYERAQRDAANYERGYSFGGAIWETAKTDTLTANMLRSMGAPVADPSFDATPQMVQSDKRLQEVPEPWKESLLNASSHDDYENRVADLLHRQDYEERISAMGGKGTWAQLVGNLIDPVGLAIGAIPAAGGPRTATILGKVLWGAASGGAGGLAVSAAQGAFDPTWTKDALLKGAAQGALMGAVLGPLAKVHPALEPEHATIKEAANGLSQSLDRRYAEGAPKPSEALMTPPPSAAELEGGTPQQTTHMDPDVLEAHLLQRAGEIDPTSMQKATELDHQMAVTQAQLAAMERPLAPRMPDAEAPARIAARAAQLDPETMGEALRLDKAIEATRQSVSDVEATKPHLEANSTEQWLTAKEQERLGQVQKGLSQITGKRRSGPAAKALQAELGDLTKKAADAQEEALTRYGHESQTLRQKIVDLQSQRGQLGPKVKAATDAAKAEEDSAAAKMDLLRERHDDAKAVLRDKLETMQAKRERLRSKVDAAMQKAKDEAGALGLRPVEPVEEAPSAGSPGAPEAPVEGNFGVTSSDKSVGAAATPGTVQPMRAETDLWMHSLTRNAYSSSKVAFKKWRLDFAGRLRASDNPVINALGTYMAADRVGNADHSTLPLNIASEEATHGQHVAQAQLTSAHVAAFKQWAGSRGFNAVTRLKVWDKFQQLVNDARAERNPAARAQFDPEVLRAADAHTAFYGDYWERIQNPGVHDDTVREPLDGANGVPKDPHYVPHIWDFQKFQDVVNRFGDTEVMRLIRESIAQQFGGKLTTEALEKMTKALYGGLRSAQTGQEISMSRMISGEDMPGLGYLLRQHGASNDEIDAIFNALSKPPEEGQVARLKERQPYMENHTVNLRDAQTGQPVPMRMRDMLNWNSLDVARMYSRSIEGQLALQRLRIPNPIYDEGLHGPGGVLEGDQKPYLADGVARDSDWDALMKQARDVGALMGHPIDQTEKTLGHLNFIRDRILGRPDPLDQTKLGTGLRILQNYNLSRALNQVGFMHIPQAWQSLSQMGLKAAWKAMPGLRAFHRDAITGQLDDDLSRMIEQSLGVGTDWIRGSGSPLPMDDLLGSVNASPWETVERGSQRLARVTTAIGGLAPMITTMQRWAARAAMVRFAMDAAGEKALNANRMAALGLEPAMQTRIADALRNDGIAKGNTGASGLAGLKMDQWDPEVRHAFTTALTRWSNKAMQENDIGQMNMMFGTRFGKLITQFRSFMFGSYANNTLHNLHMRDSETVSNFLGTSVLGALSYTAQTYAQSIGRGDQQDFLQKRLNLEHIAASAIHRGGWASIMPTLVDTTLQPLGFDPMFDVRSSGQSNSLFSPPAASLAQSVSDASRGIFGSVVRGEPYTRKDFHALLGSLPFGNFLPIMWGANALTQGLPSGDSHKIGKHTQGRF